MRMYGGSLRVGSTSILSHASIQMDPNRYGVVQCDDPHSQSVHSYRAPPSYPSYRTD
jgi:hypothetical protein